MNRLYVSGYSAIRMELERNANHKRNYLLENKFIAYPELFVPFDCLSTGCPSPVI